MNQKFGKDVSYIQLIKNIKGFHLDTIKAQKSLKVECERRNLDIIIFIRDADGIYTDAAKIKKVETWFETLREHCTCKKLLLINIYELEALIFADIETFNRLYYTSIKGNRDVKYIKEPKEELKNATEKGKRKYRESDCPDLFKELRIEIVGKNCSYFKTFLAEFSGLLDGKNAN